MTEYASLISSKLNISTKQVNNVLQLLAEGSTIPFIARYRKDATGDLDEVQIQQIQDEAKFQKEFTERKAFIEKTISEAGKMTDALQTSLNAATTFTELEDIYLPYKPKRKTRATIAKENGLEPLAMLLQAQTHFDIEQEATKYIHEKVASWEDALAGARDILAETFNEHAGIRASIRTLFEREAHMLSKVIPGKEEEAIKYKDYFEFSEPISKIPSHRILAILRGYLEGHLRIDIEPNEDAAIQLMESEFLVARNAAGEQVQKAIKDCYKRLLQPSMETEFRTALKQKADEEAIDVFAENLRQLLLSSPLGSKRILAIDPGYRSGCKVVCLDETGNLKHTDLIYIHEKNYKLQEAEHVIRSLVQQYAIQSIAIGNGTAGRETQQFIAGLQLSIPLFLVNEDGASIYSASQTGRDEFPDYDLTVRGSVSIGRRLMDPLAELVKIDPKSIGVGQYQHDVSQFRLKERLDQTVVSCVNLVGVNINTASKHLLSYVSGIGPTIAENIVAYRQSNGHFTQRAELLKVPRLGQKVYEQCAGFLKVPESDNPLDNSSVHPEAYDVVKKMAKDLSVDVKILVTNETLINSLKPEAYVTEEIGLLSIKDILKELRKPGLDPRAEAQSFEFAEIFKIEDVHPEMIVPGIVTNITRFGAFVDIGVKQDGLVHVSEIAHRYISDPKEVLKLNDKVMVKVLDVDIVRQRINLSIKQTQDPPATLKPKQKFNAPAPKKEVSFSDALSSLKHKFKG